MLKYAYLNFTPPPKTNKQTNLYLWFAIVLSMGLIQLLVNREHNEHS